MVLYYVLISNFGKLINILKNWEMIVKYILIVVAVDYRNLLKKIVVFLRIPEVLMIYWKHKISYNILNYYLVFIMSSILTQIKYMWNNLIECLIIRIIYYDILIIGLYHYIYYLIMPINICVDYSTKYYEWFWNNIKYMFIFNIFGILILFNKCINYLMYNFHIIK